MSSIKEAQHIFQRVLDTDLNECSNFRKMNNRGLDVKEPSYYALGEGKRIIVGSLSHYHSEKFMLFIEYVHSSSLIIDDLPCMDNDKTRRGKDTLHIKYNEHIAQLVAYNLMIVAMKHISDGIDETQYLYSQNDFKWLQSHVRTIVHDNLGFQGICGGQYLDLIIGVEKKIENLSRREQKEIIINMIRMKTGCLFSLSFVLGWIGHGGSINAVEKIEEAGYLFGLCYQILDDIDDISHDISKNGGYANICLYYTHNEIIDLFVNNMTVFDQTMTQYDMWNPVIKELYGIMLKGFKISIKRQQDKRCT